VPGCVYVCVYLCVDVYGQAFWFQSERGARRGNDCMSAHGDRAPGRAEVLAAEQRAARSQCVRTLHAAVTWNAALRVGPRPR
jgi:hypothetical protein